MTALAVLLALAVVAIAWYARGSYFVGVADSQLVIYKGRPGGLLWFQPTVAERTKVSTSAVLASRLSDLHGGKEEATLAKARTYVRNLQNEAQAHEVLSPPSTAPPTTAPPPTTATPPTASSPPAP
jgi:hypothetical protein